MLCCNRHIPVECAVKAYNVRRIALVEHLEFPDDLLLDCRFDFQMDQLRIKRGSLVPYANIEQILPFSHLSGHDQS